MSSRKLHDPYEVDHGEYSDDDDNTYGVDERPPKKDNASPNQIMDISEDSSDDQPIVIRKKREKRPRLRIPKRKRKEDSDKKNEKKAKK